MLAASEGAGAWPRAVAWPQVPTRPAAAVIPFAEHGNLPSVELLICQSDVTRRGLCWSVNEVKVPGGLLCPDLRRPASPSLQVAGP